LRALREDEARQAVDALGLGPSDLRFLSLPDRFVPNAGALAEKAIFAITEAAEAIEARAIFTTWRHDPHGDHQSAYLLARRAQERLQYLRLFEYSIWGRVFALDRDTLTPPEGRRFASGLYRSRKRAAIACHCSQVSDLIKDDPSGFRLDSSMVEEIICRDEVFLETPA
jgi:LmbE family N-acetylglucosaminyl deacetylase